MSGTTGNIETDSQLLNEDRDGQAVGSITPQNIRNIIASETAHLKAQVAWFSVKNYGAIGDGNSHPASASGYATLAALQAVYSFATALTNEMDWLATQLAINLAAATSGLVYSPSGTYICSNANSVSDGSGSLVFPPSDDATLGGSNNNQVNWKGDGFNATIYKWPSDLGTGKFAVQATSNRNLYNCAGYWEDIGLIGPNATVALGVAPANMSGWAWNSRREMRRLRAWGFYAGFDIVGDQTTFDSLFAQNCLYGMYFNTPSTTNWGDLVLRKCIFQYCKKAGIGVSNAANINGCRMDHVGVYQTPFGIFKETGGTNNNILADCVMISCQFENMGNAMIADAGNLSGAARVGTMTGVRMYETHFGNNASYIITTGSGAYNGVMDLHSWTDVHLDGMRSTWVPGANGMFSIDAFASCSIRGPVMALLAAAAATYPNSIFKNIGTGWSTVYWEEPGNCSGTFVQNTNVQVNQGNVLVYAGAGAGQFGNEAIQVALSAGTNSEVVMGVAAQTTPSYSPIPCIQKSWNGVTCTAGSTAIASGKYVRTSSSGNAIAATSRFDTTSPIIGFATAPLPNATSTTSFSLMTQGLGS